MGWIVISIYEYPLPQGCSVAGLIQLDQILLKQGQVKVDSWHINVMWVTVELPIQYSPQVVPKTREAPRWTREGHASALVKHSRGCEWLPCGYRDATRPRVHGFRASERLARFPLLGRSRMSRGCKFIVDCAPGEAKRTSTRKESPYAHMQISRVPHRH